MPQQIVIAEQLRLAAVLTDERIDELIVAQGRYQIGDVYLGTVENVLPGIDAAFVNIGESEKNGFIHVTDLGPLRQKKGAAGITELLKPLQPVLVQVMKEPTGNKGPRLTGNLALPGRYLVLQPNGQGVNISRKINSEAERNRLKALGVLVKPPGTGLLIRTEAEGISEELLLDDLESLFKQSEAIQQASESCSPPILLNRDDDFIHRILRDHISSDLAKVIVEDDSAVERVKNFLAQDAPNVLVEAHNKPTDLLDHYRINAAIHDALSPRVDLPSGGYIIIEPTEALTVIDVNSGSFTRSANARETVLWTNCEAAIEIARQLKLRNIGGVIIVDFIDMESRQDQLQLLEHFTSAIKNDSARPQIAQLTELGLVELTRKRQGQNIYELFGKPCQSCGGLGLTAVLPEKQLLQPLATASGLVKSATINKPDVQSLAEPNRLRKGNKSLENETIGTLIPSNESASKNEISQELPESTAEEIQAEGSLQRQEPLLVGVEIQPDQEEVFSTMGLSPLLLHESPPAHDNVMIRIVRPGEDKESVLEEELQKLQRNASRRKKKGRSGNNRSTLRGSIESQIQLESEVKVTEENQESIDNADLEGEINNSDSKNSADPEELENNIGNESIDLESKSDNEVEDDDPRRRRRRRSSASS